MDANIAREDEFLKELGQALVNWRSVEQQAYMMFCDLMKGADPTLISVAFHHIQSFETRLGLITRCVFFLKDDATKDGWEALRKRAEKLCSIRNELVHSAYVIEGKGGEMTPVIKPSFMDATALPKKRAMNDHYRHDAHKVGHHAYDFDVLARDMRAFREGATFTIATKAERAAAAKSQQSKSKGRSA